MPSVTKLPDCPRSMKCPITHERIIDPVVAQDTHSYERSAIQKWFDKGNRTSPLTREVITTKLTTNHALKSQINDWIEEQLSGRADTQNLKLIQAEMFTVSTSDVAIVIVRQIIQLITSSNFCILATNIVDTFKDLFRVKNLLNDELTELLDALATKCESKIQRIQEKYVELSTKCSQLENIKRNLKSKHNELKRKVEVMELKVKLAEKKIPAAELRLRKAQENMIHVSKRVEENKQNHKEAMNKLINHNQVITNMERFYSELYQESKTIEKQLVNVDGIKMQVEEIPSNSLSSPSIGSKRGRSSSSSSSSSTTSSSIRSIKRQKIKKNNSKKEHPGQWLYEEGAAYFNGAKFKKIDRRRGQLLICASASLGFPEALAECTDVGWNGIKKDHTKALKMLRKSEHRRAQFMLGNHYRRGEVVPQNYKKAYELFTKSAEQGSGIAMNNLGMRYEHGQGCEQNVKKALECYRKSAQLGYYGAMLNLGIGYERGHCNLTINLNTARMWYMKAAAQGCKISKENLDRLNGVSPILPCN